MTSGWVGEAKAESRPVLLKRKCRRQTQVTLTRPSSWIFSTGVGGVFVPSPDDDLALVGRGRFPLGGWCRRR